MKHLLLLFSFFALIILRTYADSTEIHHCNQGKKLLYLTMVQSNEVALDTLSQEFNVCYKVYFADTTDSPIH